MPCFPAFNHLRLWDKVERMSHWDPRLLAKKEDTIEDEYSQNEADILSAGETRVGKILGARWLSSGTSLRGPTTMS